MKRFCQCPHDGHQCQEPWLRHIAKVLRRKGADAAGRYPPSFYSQCGKRPPKEGKRPRGRPRIENERNTNA